MPTPNPDGINPSAAPDVEAEPVRNAAAADQIGEAITALETALGKVQQEERELQGTAQSRDVALAMWTVVYQGVADIITGLLELAGFSHVADRVRPTWKRRSGIAEETDTEDSGVPGGGGGTG